MGAPPLGGLGGSGAPLIRPTSSSFMGDSQSAKILGVQGILIMWQLDFALCHRLIPNKKKKKRVRDGHGRSFG